MDTVRETSTLIAANKVEGTDVFNAGRRPGGLDPRPDDRQAKRSGRLRDHVVSQEFLGSSGTAIIRSPGRSCRCNTNLGGYVGLDIEQSRARGRAVLSGPGSEPAWGDPEYERRLHDDYGVSPRRLGGPL